MTTVATSTYTQKDFEKIIHRGVSYTIPIDILHRIRDLDERIKRKVAVQSKQFENRSFKTGTRPHSSHRAETTNTWKRDNPIATGSGTLTDSAIPSTTASHNGNVHFQTSSKGPPKEGREKIVQQIKLTLNKLSRTNYEKLQKEIMDLLNQLFEPVVAESTETPEEIDLLFSKTIVDIYYILSKTTDVKMSELYAELCTSFIREQNHPLWKSVLQEQIDHYCQQLLLIEAVDPDTDNDAFCLYTKRITDNRGKAMFFTQLMKLGTIPPETVLDILENKLLGPIHECVFSIIENKKIFVDEWTEHVSLIVNLGKTFLKENRTEKWDAIMNRIQLLGQIVIKEHPNMTSRSKFKFKDLC